MCVQQCEQVRADQFRKAKWTIVYNSVLILIKKSANYILAIVFFLDEDALFV